jgi:hypothetical protein
MEYFPTVMALILISSEMHLICPDWRSNRRHRTGEVQRHSTTKAERNAREGIAMTGFDLFFSIRQRSGY